jgi:mono/diheme cytochrome c family protein
MDIRADAGMILRNRKAAALAVVGAIACASAWAQEQFPAEQVKRGAELYEVHCAACHGIRMRGTDWAPDLRTFPKTQRPRFMDTVIHGKAAMPPWSDVLKADELDALWAYLVAGDKN